MVLCEIQRRAAVWGDFVKPAVAAPVQAVALHSAAAGLVWERSRLAIA